MRKQAARLRSIFSLMAWLGCALSGAAQHQADSLERVLSTTPANDTTARVALLCELSSRYLTSQPPLALRYADEALTLARAANNQSGEALALNRLSEYHWRQSNYARSVEMATGALKLALELKDSTAMARSYRLLGIINTYGFRQFERALEYQKNALAIYERQRDYLNMASLYGNITWIYGTTGKNLTAAKAMAWRGVRLADSLRSIQLLSYNYNSLGLIALREGQWDSTLYYLQQSNRYGRQINDRAVMAYNKSIAAEAMWQKKDVRQAFALWREAEQESLALNLREVLKEVYAGRAQAHAEIGQFQEAYDYQQKFSALKDSLVNWEIAQEALVMQLAMDEQKREVQLIALAQEADRERREKHLLRWALLGGTAAFFVILGLIVRNNRQRRRNNEALVQKNKEIAEQNQQLTQANGIKARLFSIIGHDLRGPIQSLKGMLGLVVRQEVTNQEFQQFAPQLHQHVVSVNETLENLLHWSRSQMEGWTQNPSAVAVLPIVQRVAALFRETAHQKNISLALSVPPSLTVWADADQLEMILRNLLHNAIKFTSAGGAVSLEAMEQGPSLSLAVTDTGIGMSHDQLSKLFDQTGITSTRGTRNERGTGLGLALCYEMAKRNGGTITATSEPGHGSRFVLTLPRHATSSVSR